jgi:hypothetical protein
MAVIIRQHPLASTRTRLPGTVNLTKPGLSTQNPRQRGFERNGDISTVIALARFHQTLSVARAMEAGILGHVWTLHELVGLLVTPASEARP